MKLGRAAAGAVAALLLLLALTACSEQAPTNVLDPEAIDIVLTTEPMPALQGEEALLRAEIAGIEAAASVQVTFDLRKSEESVLIDAQEKDGPVYTGAVVFEEAGIQTVYVHLYVDDLHITQKRMVEVSAN